MSNNNIFVHSVPVPRLYKVAAKTVSSSANGGSVKQQLFNKRLHPNQSGVFALVAETIKHEYQLNDFFMQIDIFNQEPRLDPWLARVLFTELIWRKKTIAGDSKPVQTVLRYYNKYKVQCDALGNSHEESITKKVQKPRYVRINTLKLSTADAIRNFQDDGWNLIRCTSGSYDDYLKQLENLEESDFIPDYHVKVVLAFPPKTRFHDCPAYHNSEIFLQDKATCLAGHLLSPTVGSTVLDMCAAPGMKTTHLAALIRNEGVIYSVEQDKKRFEVLTEFVESAGATCVKLFNKDVATLTKSDCPGVDYILLDPSCSGSGIDRFGCNDTNFDFESGRLKKLSSFQAKLLRHALNEFNTAKRIVYSTCSLYPQENEEVIKDVLENHRGKFKLVSAKEKLNNNWKNVGDFKYTDIGEKCIYARPDSDLTSGFFVAVLEQSDESEFDPTISKKKNESVLLENKNDGNSKMKNKLDNLVVDDINDELNVFSENKSKKKKKNKNKINLVENGEAMSMDNSVIDKLITTKKSKKRNIESEIQDVDEHKSEDNSIDISSKNKKKRKHEKEFDVSVDLATDNKIEKKEKIKKHKICDTKTEIEDSNECESIKSLPKKKKSKHREAQEVSKNFKADIEFVSNEKEMDVISETGSKKKKDKRKNKTNVTDNNDA